MPIIPNHAKQCLERGDIAVGMGLRQARTVDIAMIAKACDFDWLFVDMEHNSMSIDTAVQICVAALAAEITPLVRVPGHQHFHASRALDGGAMGVVVPHVDTVEQAEAAANACKYPPIGHRSITGAMPQLAFEAMPVAEMTRVLNENMLVVVMLETPLAIDNAEAIAAVDGIDVLLIGTNDLTAEMGIPGQLGDERVERAYERTIAACRKHGKYAGMGGIYDTDLTQKYIRMGAQLILGGSDIAFMIAGGKERMKFLRSINRTGG